MQFVVERALIPDPSRIEAVRASARPMLDPELQAEPRRFFAFLDAPPHDVHLVRQVRRRRLDGGAAHDCRIQSDYVPYLVPERPDELTPVHVELWHHESNAPRGTVVALHGFTMGRPRIDAALLMAGQWYRRGLDVALVTLPYHGARTPPEARFSGERFASPDVSRLSEAVREAVYEIRQVIQWRREETGAPVGLLGLSLGGYLASLMGGLCEDLDFLIPMAPPACIGDLAWGFLEHAQRHQDPTSLSYDELRRAFRVHSPLAHPLRVPRERVLIVGGRGDRIVPPHHPAALWQHWERPKIHWFSGSHLAPFGRGRIVQAILRHLEELAVL